MVLLYLHNKFSKLTIINYIFGVFYCLYSIFVDELKYFKL